MFAVHASFFLISFWGLKDKTYAHLFCFFFHTFPAPNRSSMFLYHNRINLSEGVSFCLVFSDYSSFFVSKASDDLKSCLLIVIFFYFVHLHLERFLTHYRFVMCEGGLSEFSTLKYLSTLSYIVRSSRTTSAGVPSSILLLLFAEIFLTYRTRGTHNGQYTME